MSEYWKSTPRYWCKNCSVYVRDTPLERQNHEATGRHQGAVRRALRDLHRGHEREERDKDRARREVERLNGVVSSSSGGTTGPPQRREDGGPAVSAPPASASQSQTQAQRQRQLEQLAGLGVSIPEELRGDLAMAGDWTVTATRVILEGDDADGDDAKKERNAAAAAMGVRKRGKTEEEREEEEAMGALFKKRKQWGRDIKTMPGDEEADLDALLGGALIKKKEEEEEEEEEEDRMKKEEEKAEYGNGGNIPAPKAEGGGRQGAVGDNEEETTIAIKPEPEAVEEPKAGLLLSPSGPSDAVDASLSAEQPAVVFKKRKKNTKK